MSWVCSRSPYSRGTTKAQRADSIVKGGTQAASILSWCRRSATLGTIGNGAASGACIEGSSRSFQNSFPMSFSTAHLTTLDIVCVPLHDTLGARSGWGLRGADKQRKTQRPHCQWEAWGDWAGAPRRPHVESRPLTTTLDSLPSLIRCLVLPLPPSPRRVSSRTHSLPLFTLSFTFICASRAYICGLGHLLQHSTEGSDVGEKPKSLKGSPGPLLGDPVLQEGTKSQGNNKLQELSTGPRN